VRSLGGASVKARAQGLFRPSPSGATIRVDSILSVSEFRRQRVGCTLEAWRADLVTYGRELKSARAFQGSSFVDDALRLLDRLTCRIGLIGQVKAGKSSLSNALACKPDMLPTDVNPFTTVVTHVHFGRSDVPADVAAEFTFFEANEWAHLAGGVRHIRELTQELVPGFDVEQLQKQVDQFRRRAEQRLGPALSSLLGQKHVFSSLSTEILKRYVSSELTDSATGDEGAYSDIVKAADLYFASNDFGFPTTIIDTPGTNDPFLVRDEIARRALESAHVHIVLLTPRQVLSPADLALLRILQALRKNRIVVFINRIDELADIAGDLPVIVQHVRNSLRRELPTLDLPVVAGSAYWANVALRGSPADADRAWSEKAKAYGQHVAQRAGAGAGQDVDVPLAQNLLLCSGVPALLDVLADLTRDSHAGRVLQRISRSFCDIARVSENAARQELAAIESEVQSGGDYKKHGEAELRAIDAEAKEYERSSQVLQSLLTDLEGHSAQKIVDQCGKISAALREVVRGFSEAQSRSARAALDEGRGGVWRCDPTPLQRQLEEALVGASRQAEQELAELETGIFQELKDLLRRYNARWGESAADGGSEPGSLELPLLGVLGLPSIAIDLGQPRSKRWWSRDRSDERRIAELKNQIEADWRKITDALLQTARTHLQAIQSSIVREANQVYAGVAEVFKQANRLRLERARALVDSEKLPDKSELERSREVRMAELKTQISDLNRLAGRLDKINRDMRREDRTWR
jgi:hypothetical protein